MDPEQINLAKAIWRMRTERQLMFERKGFLSRIFCGVHSLHWLWNIYGDEIIHRNYKRSAWQCSQCGAVIFGDELMSQLEQEKLDQLLNELRCQEAGT